MVFTPNFDAGKAEFSLLDVRKDMCIENRPKFWKIPKGPSLSPLLLLIKSAMYRMMLCGETNIVETPTLSSSLLVTSHIPVHTLPLTLLHLTTCAQATPSLPAEKSRNKKRSKREKVLYAESSILEHAYNHPRS